jgi:hypothetical protein
MKNLEVWSDSNGALVFKESLGNIEKLEVSGESLYVILKNGFSKEFLLIENGFGYSFRVG